MVNYSILLPTHNRADVLPFAIQSALWQTEQDFELLIVGDGCTDHTAEVVAQFDDPRIHWFDMPKAPNFGYANRNTVLKEAKGVYIAFLGHDNIFFPDHLEKLGKALYARQSLWGYSRPLWVTRNGQVFPGVGSLHHRASWHEFQTLGLLMPATSVMYHRDCHDRYGYWDETLLRGGDWDLWKRYVSEMSPEDVAFLPEPTSLHFQANWRTKKNYGAGKLGAWYALAERENLIPSNLKIYVPENLTEQQAFFETMQSDPTVWVEHIRHASVALVEHLAELYLYESVTIMENNALAWKILRALTTTGWLRKLRRMVAPPSTRREAIWIRLKREDKHGKTKDDTSPT